MKLAIKIIALFLVGLFMAIIVYPIMHELGHSATAMLVGAEVIEINLFPLPNVLCDVARTDKIGIVFIGLSGMSIPFFISAVIKPKYFWIWYANYILQGISALAFIIATISAICFITGNPMPNDDITQVLTLWSNGQWLCLAVSIVMSLLAIFKLAKEKPFIRCIQYFDKGSIKKASAA